MALFVRKKEFLSTKTLLIYTYSGKTLYKIAFSSPLIPLKLLLTN